MRRIINTFAKIGERKQGFSGELKSTKTTAYPGKAHVRDCSTFTNDCARGFTNDFETDEPGNLWHAGQQWTNDDIGNFTLDQARRQLPQDPTPRIKLELKRDKSGGCE